MAIAVSYFPVYEWTTTFLLCWLSLSSTTVETWTVWTVEQLLIEPLLESSLKTVSTTPRQLHVVHLRPGWKTNGNWQLTTGSQPNFDNWLKTKLTLLCIKVSKSPFCLGHHAAQSSDARWYGHLEIKCWKLPKHFPCHWAWQEGHPKSQSKVRPVQKTLIYVQRASLWLTHRKYQLESWMLTSKEEQTSAFWGSMSKGFEARKEIVWEWSSRTSTRWTRQAKWALVKFLK